MPDDAPESFKVWPMSLYTARPEDGRGYVLIEPAISPLEGFSADVEYYADDSARIARAKSRRTITDRKFKVTPVSSVSNRTRIKIEFLDKEPLIIEDLDEFARAVGKVVSCGGVFVEIIPYKNAAAAEPHDYK